MNEAAYRTILQRLGVASPRPHQADSEIARRADAFRAQLDIWIHSGRPGVPLLILPGAPEPGPGRCVSCGDSIPENRWRCGLCLQAVELVLGVPERRRSAGGEP